MIELAIVVPTRGRPSNITKVIGAWDSTNAWDHADLILVADADDPEIDGYRALIDPETCPVQLMVIPDWIPMVHKLNEAAYILTDQYWAIGFAGDDHLPRTKGWAGTYLEALREMGTGIVYGDDLHHGRNLPTEWAMTSDIIRTLGRMVPAPVEHMYCDNSVLDLGTEANCIRYLDSVHIEHMHPVWQKGEWDPQYRRVNSRQQYQKDGRAYRQWKQQGLAQDAEKIRQLRESNG